MTTLELIVVVTVLVVVLGGYGGYRWSKKGPH